MKRRYLPLLRIFLMYTFFLSFIHQDLFAQKTDAFVVSGSVSGEKGELLQGVVVEVVNAQTRVLTDANGKFTINLKVKSAELRFTYTGYEDKTVKVSEASNNLKIVLSFDTKGLEDVAVIGYATIKKKDVTGSVAGINQQDIKSRPVQDALQAMQGKVAGVDISSNERPGSIASINIRGVRSLTASNSPLFVVDGIPLITGGIENLNPSDIESIDILKDASATAIYGSRGANGVVIVTTKQGKNGKTTLSFNSSLKFENLVDNEAMFNASDYITFRRWSYYYAGLNTATS